MEGLTASCSSGGRFLTLLPPPSSSTKHPSGRCSFSRRRYGPFPAFSSSRDGPPPDLDQWDQMELKFGRLLGEDPKLTMAKIMGRKANPDASYMDIEKSLRKKKGKVEEIVEVPLDWDVKGRNAAEEDKQRGVSSSSSSSSLLAGLRAPSRGKKSAGAEKLNLTRPAAKGAVKNVEAKEQPAVLLPRLEKPVGKVSAKRDSPDVALRKPPHLQGDADEAEKPSRLTIRPNLLLKMRKDSEGGSLSDMTLLKKPEVTNISLETPAEASEGRADSDLVGNRLPEVNLRIPAGIEKGNDVPNESSELIGSSGDFALPTSNAAGANAKEPSGDDLASDSFALDEGTDSEEDASSSEPLDYSLVQPIENISLQGKPQRLDSPTKEISLSDDLKISNLNEDVSQDLKISNLNEDVSQDSSGELLISAEQEEYEDSDWRLAENLLRTGEREEVELISCSSRGFLVSFGSLVGFLPYRNLGAKWKFLAFESWLRKKGLDPSLYRQNLSIVGSYSVQTKDLSMASNETSELDKKDEEKLSPSMKFEELLEIYDHEKTKFLSSFIGQRIKVAVVMVDRKSRKIMFSGRPKEKEELVERKRSLMAKLSIGDIVKCCIKKITYFGIFVEVDGVPALIHQSEVSWDVALDPSSFFKIGQIIDAKVHQLDYSLERITLSLKEITPDPLNEALESVVGERTLLGANVEASQGDVEWADVESLIKELEQIDGVIGVSKGRFFLSPGLAPTFQVYMASMYENQYKLLARYGNKVQEVMVQSSLDKEQMKATILTCTNRVE